MGFWKLEILLYIAKKFLSVAELCETSKMEFFLEKVIVAFSC